MGNLNVNVVPEPETDGGPTPSPGDRPLDWWMPGFLRFALLTTATISFVAIVMANSGTACICFVVSLAGLAVSYQRGAE
jgi:hypothetical protein